MDGPLSPARLGVQADLAAMSWDQRLLLTGLVILGAGVLRAALPPIIRRSMGRSDRARQAASGVRNGSILLALAILIGLWSGELGDFALSIAAFGVAIVIASKELILCLAGGLLRSANGAFHSGDWIEVGDISGEVAQTSLLVTEVQEIDPREMRFTGRSMTLPNALFLTTPVINNGFRKRYLFHAFTLYAEPSPRAAEAAVSVRRALETAAEDFRDVAARYAAVIEKRADVTLPDTAPSVRLATTDLAKLRFEVRVFCPRERAMDMERAAMEGLLAWQALEAARFGT